MLFDFISSKISSIFPNSTKWKVSFWSILKIWLWNRKKIPKIWLWNEIFQKLWCGTIKVLCFSSHLVLIYILECLWIFRQLRQIFNFSMKFLTFPEHLPKLPNEFLVLIRASRNFFRLYFLKNFQHFPKSTKSRVSFWSIIKFDFKTERKFQKFDFETKYFQNCGVVP